MGEFDLNSTPTQVSVFEGAEIPFSNPVFNVLRHHFEISAGYSVGQMEVFEPNNELMLALGLSIVHRASGLRVFRLDERDFVEHLEDDLSAGLNMHDSDDWKALTSIKRGMEENTTLPHFIALTLLAAEHLPEEGYDGGRVPKPSKGRESTSHKIFRTAIEFLRRQASGDRITHDEKIDMLAVVLNQNLHEVATSDTEEGEQFRKKSMPKLMEMLVARDILTTFQVHSPQQIQDDLNRTYRSMAHRYQLDVPMDETGWEILPMEELESLGSSGFQEEEDEYSPHYSFIDWTRIRRLKQHIHDWPGAYMAVASLEAQGDEEYYVAVLPAKIGQLAVEHALGDNPSSGNAVYAWRAEKGLVNGQPAVTWRGVYRHTKRMARALGARRMLHTENVDWNILDYLTRPADKLDVPGYSKPG